MVKSLVSLLLALSCAVGHAAVDANKATQPELEAIKGIGPAVAQRLLDERQKQPFADWSDMATRVKGVGPGNAAKFSAAGLTVNGSAYASATPNITAPTTKPAPKAAKGEPRTAAMKAATRP